MTLYSIHIKGTFCDQSTIQNYGSVGPSYNIDCRIGCTLDGGSTISTIGTTAVKCTAFSILNNWSQGEETFYATIPKTSHFSASTIGGDWRSLAINSGIV
jgi:hypothetical protein